MKSSFLKKRCDLGLFWLIPLVLLMPTEGWADLAPEKLDYRLRYMWILPVGKVSMSVEPYLLDKKDIYQISGSYHSPAWFSMLFNLKGRISSYIDTRNLLPLRYEEFYSYPWHDDIKTVLIYDQDRKRVYIDRNGEKETKHIFENTVDPLSALFFARNQTWSVGEERKFNLNNHQSNYQLTMRCDRYEKISGYEAAHVMGDIRKYDAAAKISNVEFEIWISRPPSRLPLKMNVQTKLGHLSLQLRRKDAF